MVTQKGPNRLNGWGPSAPQGSPQPGEELEPEVWRLWKSRDLQHLSLTWKFLKDRKEALSHKRVSLKSFESINHQWKSMHIFLERAFGYLQTTSLMTRESFCAGARWRTELLSTWSSKCSVGEHLTTPQWCTEGFFWLFGVFSSCFV